MKKVEERHDRAVLKEGIQRDRSESVSSSDSENYTSQLMRKREEKTLYRQRSRSRSQSHRHHHHHHSSSHRHRSSSRSFLHIDLLGDHVLHNIVLHIILPLITLLLIFRPLGALPLIMIRRDRTNLMLEAIRNETHLVVIDCNTFL